MSVEGGGENDPRIVVNESPLRPFLQRVSRSVRSGSVEGAEDEEGISRIAGRGQLNFAPIVAGFPKRK